MPDGPWSRYIASLISAAVLWTCCLTSMCPAQDKLPAIFPPGISVPPYPGLPTPDLGTGTLPERLALFIGINHYESGGTLPIENLSNAEQDAEDVGRAFHAAGFFTYFLTGSRQRRISGSDLVTRNDILSAVDALNQVALNSKTRSGRHPVILVYFAGHGINMNDRDFLLPSDFQPGAEEDVGEMGILVNEIEDRLSWSDPTLRIIIADACRTQLPVSALQKLKDPSSVAPVSAFTPPGLGPGSELGMNDEILAFSTLKGEPAKDRASPGSQADDPSITHNGAFARALIDAMGRARARSLVPDSLGSDSSLESILMDAGNAMKLDEDSYQVSEYVHRSAIFVLYPTESDYRQESDAWKLAGENVKHYITSQSDATPEAFSRGIYCYYTNFLKTASFYSFYGAAGIRERSRFGKENIDCSGLSPLSTEPMGTVHPDFQKPIDGHWKRVPADAKATHGHLQERIRFAQGPAPSLTDAGTAGGETRPLTVGAVRNGGVLSVAAEQEIAGFDDTTLAGDLAVVHGVAVLFKDPGLTMPSGDVIHDNDLVRLLALPKQSLKQNSIQVETSAGSSGYLDQRNVDHPSIAVTFHVSVEKEKDRPFFYYDVENVDPILRSGLVGSMLIQYPMSAGLQGFINASLISQRFLPSLDPGHLNLAKVVPSTAPLRADDPGLSGYGPTDLKITLTLTPFDREVRKRFLSLSGLTVDPTLAVSIDGPSQPTINDADKGTFSDNPVCASALSNSSAGSSKPATLYVQFSDERQRRAVEVIRTLAKLAGFSVPAAELKAAVPRSSQIRVCRGSEGDAAGKRLSKVADQCSLGRFDITYLGTCSKTAKYSPLELWLSADFDLRSSRQ